jgi:hypothetical protein
VDVPFPLGSQVVPGLSYCNAQLNACRISTESESESESYVTTDGQSASLSWNKAPRESRLKAGSRYTVSARTAEKTSRPILVLLRAVSVGNNTRRLLSQCLATGVFTETFPSKGCLSWLHNSDFQKTRHSMLGKGVKNTVTWVVTLCRWDIVRRFGGTYHFHLHSRKVSQSGKQ